LPKLEGERVLCALTPECQVAVALADQRPSAEVTCFFLDVPLAEFARSTQAAGFENIDVACAADVPSKPYDLFLLPFPSHGDLELARDLLEQGTAEVREGGTVAVAVEIAGERHLKEEMKKLFARPQRHPCDDGVIYFATKTAPLKKRREFREDFAFRDGERLIAGISRPGLWSHRKLVGGIRPLLDKMEIRAGEKVLNPGCDVGALALAAAQRAEGVKVIAVDSNPRAVECTLAGAAKNGLTNIEAHVVSGRWQKERGTFDVVLACPPYMTNERVSDVFIDGAFEALKPGGRVILSSKHRVWYADELARGFDDIQVDEVREFNMIRAVKRGRSK
jgi:16S rRNA (guanine1207-N2)-methyltransferase